MNFKKLQEMQQALDDAILKEKPEMTAEERFEKTCVALSVEVAELANTAEHFKFWKENKGKIEKDRFVKVGMLSGENNFLLHDTISGGVVSVKEAHKLTLVEEASDCLHFILSLANQMEVEIHSIFDFETTEEDLFLNLCSQVHHLWNFSKEAAVFKKIYVISLVDVFLSYTGKLGIAIEELEQAYYDKNEVNYQRLEQGY